MLNIDAIETINFEQLATVTDRLLLRGRFSKRRASTSQRSVERVDQAPERSLHIRSELELRRWFAASAVLVSLFGATAAIVGLL